MSSGDNQAPIIIKRKKVSGGGGHHGGAWKVAYADFVTAMMAFFLLMWLLNATTEKQRKGIADYFNPTIAVNRISGGGDGSFGGDSVFSEETIAQMGTGASMNLPTEQRQAKGQNGSEAKDESDSAEFDQVAAKIEEALMGVGGESMVTDQLAKHIVTKVTDEGLIVEFFDLVDEPLFAPETGTPEPILEELVAMVSRVFTLVPNEVAINGFTRSYPEMLRTNPVWDLSTERVQQVRKLLQQDGFETKRIQRVTGFADRKPASDIPMSIRNNRLEIILLRN
ncbi:flagellar motor protein MotB [Thioclava sp. GXIMD2076]|uniref:Flagellar motor protein MotB n=1 Tax=Thioclava kandeliae TaxID=3070818 RepID=A0ABV1SKT1_9RHOB